MTKLFASDFDGTLHFHDERESELISARDLAAIKAFQAEGGLFGACTGRPFYGLADETGHEIPFDFYIAGTGSVIFDRDWNCIWRNDIPKEAAEELYFALRSFAIKEEWAFVISEDNYWVITDKPVPFFMKRAQSFSDLKGPFAGGALETNTIEEAEEAALYVRENFAGVFDAFVNLSSIDVVPAGCSKGAGLRRAAQLFDATITAGIGDSYNDIPLLEAADVAYTFTHVDKRVQSVADHLVSCAAEAIEDFAAR